MPGRRSQSRWLPASLWACLIFALSGVPSLGTDLGVWDTVLRKLAHATEYAILAVLLTRALSPPAAWLGAVAFAVTDELHQALVPGGPRGRSTSRSTPRARWSGCSSCGMALTIARRV